MDEVEAATASITQPNSEEDADDILNSVTLEHSAEQILNGIKRQVEVQYLVPMVNDSEAGQQNEQTTEQQTDSLQCSFKESGEDIVINVSFRKRSTRHWRNKIWWIVKFIADFLNPISKEVVAEECGLVSEGYLVTDPTILGLNMVDPEIIGSENLFGEELSFQFYELTSPSQLQSAWHTEGNKVRLIVIDELQIQNARSYDNQPVREVGETEKTVSERENSQRKSLVNSDRANEDCTMTRSWSYSRNFSQWRGMFDHFIRCGC